MDTGNLTYRNAFETYVRRGTPIALTLKQQSRPTTHYIWRTRRDGKVRPSHATNDRKIFAWDNPPPTGHPGEDYGCRCTAEPYLPVTREQITITLTGTSGDGSAWTSRNFVEHYFRGKGRGVTVRETGHLRSIVSAYMGQVETWIENHIAGLARQNKNGSFSDDFRNTYKMTGIAFSIGDTTIGGEFSGSSSEQSGILKISGELEFYLRDEFVDPLDIGVEVIDPVETIYENLQRPIESRIQDRVNRLISDRISQRKQDRLGVHTGEPYPITDEWSGKFEGKIYADNSRSIYG